MPGRQQIAGTSSKCILHSKYRSVHCGLQMNQKWKVTHSPGYLAHCIAGLEITKSRRFVQRNFLPQWSFRFRFSMALKYLQWIPQQRAENTVRWANFVPRHCNKCTLFFEDQSQNVLLNKKTLREPIQDESWRAKKGELFEKVLQMSRTNQLPIQPHLVTRSWWGTWNHVHCREQQCGQSLLKANSLPIQSTMVHQ